MILKELDRDRQLSELTGQPLCETNKRIDEFFDKLFDGIHIEEDDRYMVFSKAENSGRVIYMRQDSKYGLLYVSYVKIWRFFKDSIGFNYTDIQSLMQSRVEEHYNMRVFTPDSLLQTFKD